MIARPLGRTGMNVTPIGFGAFKIGRNQKAKYPRAYALPDDQTTERLLNGVLDLGINYIDTAPAYGCSEERIGRFLSHRRSEFVLSTKVGERFADGVSTYDYSAPAVRDSLHESLRRLRTDVLDTVFVHSHGDDLAVLRQTDVVGVLLEMKAAGDIRAVGMSGKTVEGCRASLGWADVLMVEYHLNDRRQEPVIAEAAARGVAVVVKKGLASGRLPADEAIRFVLANSGVSSLLVGGLDIDHLRANVAAAQSAVGRAAG